MKARVTTGVVTGLVLCIGSGWLLVRAPPPVGETAVPGPVSAFRETRLFPGLSAEKPAPVPATISTVEQSRLLQLEIERALVSVDDAQREKAYAELVPALIRVDPAALKRLIERVPSGPVREELLRQTARTWSSIDLQEAISWAEGVTESNERTIAASGIVSKVAQSDPARAIEVSDVLGIGRNDGTVEHIATLWAYQNLGQSLRWVESQPAGSQRDQLLARIAAVEAQTAPAEAANTALREVSPGAFQEQAVIAAVRSWSYQDLTAASDWVSELPQGRLRELARAELARMARSHDSDDSR